MTRRYIYPKLPTTITQLRHRLPGWKVTYTTEECREFTQTPLPFQLIGPSPWRRKKRSRRLIMHVIHAMPHGFAKSFPWRGVPYVEARFRTKAEACAVVFLGVRGLEDIWAAE